MKLPFVSRDSYDGAKRLAESERENAQHLRREVIDLGAQWAKRYDDLMARYHEATSRTADALDTVIKPAPVQVNAPVPDFQSFPPIVAGALALANAGFPKDIQRANYVWAEAQLKSGMKPDQVAAELRHGMPVNTEMSEYPD